MKISWFTVLAQIINFIILIWLLKRFLYQPVLKAIDDREKKIASELKDAMAKETEAKKEQKEFMKKNEKFDHEKKALMDQAVAETNEERDKLMKAARDEAAALRTKLVKALAELQDKMDHDITQKTQNEVFAIAGKALADLASLSLEEQSVKIFISRINGLKKEEKKQFLETFKSGSGPVLVRSAYDLPKKQQTEIESAVKELLGNKTQFQFKTAPELISGIDLTSNGYKLAWSISEYLNSLKKSIEETMQEATMKEEPKKEPKEEPKKEPVKEPVKIPKEVPIEVPEEGPVIIPPELPEKK